MGLAVSPLAPPRPAELPPLAGVRIAVVEAGIKYKDRRDLLLVELAKGSTAAGVFTLSSTAAAPVGWCRKALTGGAARALIVNSGNANAFTGKAGDESVERTVNAVAQQLGCKAEDVFVSSTGVIGQPLPDDKITAQIPALHKALDADKWHDAAEAIRTTDTFAKLATRQARIGDAEVTIHGIAKGSGMIAPNMATMLGYIFTDASIPQEILQALLAEAADLSFNSITVDSDCSTNDTVLAFATHQVVHADITNLHDPVFHAFREAFCALAIDLAQQVVRDGEGATKFITIQVSGAKTHASARIIALAIANSPLVKTAIAGEDANWGRIVMAIGKSGEPVEAEHISIAMGGVMIARDGGVIPGYDETPVAAHMKEPNIDITVEVGRGTGVAKVWTCDLTHGYIEINADYRS